MRYFYDWEFLDNGGRIRPISIGIVAEDGRELYLVSEECAQGEFERDIARHAWLMDNVVPHLPLRRGSTPRQDGFKRLDGRVYGFSLDLDDNRVVPLRFIANAVRDFLTAFPNEHTELWGYFPAYDHVVLAQLWGPMSKLPTGIPMRTHCVAQYADMLGVDLYDLPQHTGTAHNALDDARWTRDCWRHLERLHTYGSLPRVTPADLYSLGDFRHLDGEAPPLADMVVTVRRGGIPRPLAAEEALAWLEAHPGADAPVMYEPGTCPDGATCWMHAMRHVHPVETYPLRRDGILPLPPEE